MSMESAPLTEEEVRELRRALDLLCLPLSVAGHGTVGSVEMEYGTPFLTVENRWPLTRPNTEARQATTDAITVVLNTLPRLLSQAERALELEKVAEQAVELADIYPVEDGDLSCVRANGTRFPDRRPSELASYLKEKTVVEKQAQEPEMPGVDALIDAIDLLKQGAAVVSHTEEGN